MSASISVVIPSYNHAAFLTEAVASVRSQSLPADELVVVDDGSTDGSPEVLERLRFEGMRLELQENRGAHEALNRAIASSRGDWIAILDSDDVMEPGRLEEAWGIASATGAGLVCGGVSLIGEDGGGVPEGHDIARWHAEVLDLAGQGATIEQALRTHNVAVTTSNFFLHRSLWELLGGFRAWRYVHDYDFLLRATMRVPGRVAWVPSHRSVRYRVHGSNTISEAHERALAERADMLRDVRSLRSRLGAAVGRAGRRRVADAIGRASELAPVRGDAMGGANADRVDAAVEKADATDATPMRVGIVATSLDTGGLEEVVALLAQALPSAGLEAMVFCTARGGAVAARLARSGVSVTVGDGTPEGCAAWVRDAGVDVVSSHFVPLGVVRALAEADVPVVETIHNCYAWLGKVGWDEERERARIAGRVIAVSRPAAAYWSTRVDRAVDAVVGNAVHPGRVARVPRAFARGRLGLDSGTPVAVAVGRLTRQKNLDGMLRAFAAALDSVPEARLLLVGPHDSTERIGEIRARHPGLFDVDRVRWLGARADIGVVLSAADAFVSSSFYEGWSVAASEAAWLGLPLLLTRAGAAGVLVGEAGERGVLVPSPLEDPLAVDEAMIEAVLEAGSLGTPLPASAASEAAMAEALVRVLGDPPEWRARAGATAAWAREALAPRAMAEGYAAVLREAVSGPVRP